MTFSIKMHYDNYPGFRQPYLWIWYFEQGYRQDDFAPTGQDEFGLVYDISVKQPTFGFKFKEGPGLSGHWEDRHLDRTYHRLRKRGNKIYPSQVWARGYNAFVYTVEPRKPEADSAETYLKQFIFKPGLYVPETGCLSGLGANLLEDGRVMFGLYHPHAAQVYVIGNFNDWQHPSQPKPNKSKFIELKLYRGYFDLPNIWLGVTDQAKVGDEYKFFIDGGVPKNEKGKAQLSVTDPYARYLGQDYSLNNAVIVDPSSFQWADQDWRSPDISELILYEMSVYGFTEGDRDIKPEHRGKFKGVTERIQAGYFERLGVTALSLMPLAEVPTMQGPETLGYNSSLFLTVERDFGFPDDLREMVNTAHQKGLAVLIDEVFNHTSNDFNPLWKLILEHPDEEGDPVEGGLYFNGNTPWGNRVATERTEVQNMLIDACKLLISEYHVDGFRYDATHSSYMDHAFLNRLADELKAFKPDVLLVAENLPNEVSLNRQGYDGYAQWSNEFHDKIKALLREGEFEGKHYDTDHLGEIFYFSKGMFASHTNNVVNYCESHDENSVPHESNFSPNLNTPAAKERKGRLGLFATVVALGQPMIYMGQEFNMERSRNTVAISWPENLEQHGFFQWASRLMQLRQRYPGLRLQGYNPAEEGIFSWIIAPWLAPECGGERIVIGWRATPNGSQNEAMVVLLNFENVDVEVDVHFGLPGIWVRLANIDEVNDLPPTGSNSAEDPSAIRTENGQVEGFVLPDSSGFIYKWIAPL